MFKLKRLQFILVVILLQLTLSVNAQVYPVQGNVVLNPPYSPYLADLTALGSQRFWLSLRLQDPTLSTYNCKLRLTIEGVGITIRTKNTFLPPPITLEGGGIPQLFYGDDLAAYFNPTNLDFAGLTRSQYERTQRLPEGVYRFTIEVLDYNRGTVVSTKIGTTAWIVLNDPPLLNLPANNTKINILDPTNIAFTWTPRHTGSPNAAFTTNYIFKLIELAPNATGQAANAAFLSQPVLFETTLSQNQFVYGPAEPSLLAGRKYAWQVQARDTEGRDLFRNNGKSEVFVFQYGDALGVPRNVLQQGGNATTLSLAWELPSQGEMPAQYRIRYKPYTSPANNWFESVTTGRYYTIGGLNPSTNYIVQVRSERGSIFSEYSAPLQMSTISLEERGYTCGGEPVLKPPTSTEILPRLFPGDEIKMHDFSVMVMTVEGSNGNYSGTGLMRVSLFNNASVKVRFSGRVNIHYELAGEIVSLPRKNSAMGQLVDEMEKIGADRKRAQDSVANATNPTPVPITITGIIDSVWVQDSVIVVQREDGTQEEIVRPQAQDGTPQQVVLTDSVGNTYTVDEEGEVNRTNAQGVQGGNNASAVPQNPFEQLVKDILGILKTEEQSDLDSLRLIRNEKMQILDNSIIDAGFSNERYLITGAQDQLIAEGFSKLLEERPVKSQDDRGEDQAIFLIEDSYVDLYEADVILEEKKVTIHQLENWDQGGFSILISELRQVLSEKPEEERTILETDQEKMKLFLTETIESKLNN
jgi:Fibronectin type III domain